MSLLRPVHRCALRLPDFERFELASQLRRASKSVPTNIAEGYGKRRSSRHFKACLENALGSSNEMIVHLQVAETLDYVRSKDAAPMIDEYRVVCKLLVRLIEKWK